MGKVPLVQFLTIYGPLLSLKARGNDSVKNSIASIHLGQASKRKLSWHHWSTRIDYCGFQVIQNCSERPNGYFGKILLTKSNNICLNLIWSNARNNFNIFPFCFCSPKQGNAAQRAFLTFDKTIHDCSQSTHVFDKLRARFALVGW
jgi:hypothetical protein